ncbi:2697_t:CDS:2, partial [Racocetra persica]
MMLVTLGIESTLFMKSQNACIKCVLENNNTFLCELGKVMMNHVEEWLKQKQYEAWTRGIPSISNTVTVFPIIEALIRCYLRPNVIQYLLNQIKESVYYIALCSSIKEVENMSINEPSQDEDLEDELDSVSICAKFLLQQLDYSSIIKIWNISRIPKESHQDVAVEDDHFGQ